MLKMNFNIQGLRAVLGQYANFWKLKINHKDFRIPDMCWDQNFEIEIAKKQEDLETVFRLQHDANVARGLSKPHRSGMKCSIYHFLPHTNHVIVRLKGRVVASMTLIADSNLGLPADKFFADELNDRRQQGVLLVELSSFVVDRTYKASSKVLSHLLMKYALNYVRRFTACGELIITVHPSMTDFYAANWYFLKQSEVVKFHSNKQALTVLMTHPLTRKHHKFFVHSFSDGHITKNVAFFVSKRDKRFRYPQRSEGQVVHPTMTPQMLEYFFLEKTNLYEELDLNTRQIFLEMYLQFFGEQEIERFLNIEREVTLKEFRIPVSTRAAVKSGPQFFVGHIRDLTTSGCFIEVPSEIKNTREELTLNFRIGGLDVQVQGTASWRNLNNQGRYGHGYGIKFQTPVQQLHSEIKNWLPMPTRKVA